MKFHQYVPALPLLLFGTNFSLAADQNGYTAQYECRAGGAYCNVDVQSLTTRACDQTITPSTPWSSINWSNNTICIEAGDHTGKGTLTVPAGTSGTHANRKVLRYTRAGDTNDDPWRQSVNDQARLSKVSVQASYWVIQRLAFPSLDQDLGERVEVTGGQTDVIIDRLLVEGSAPGNWNTYQGIVVECCNAQRITIQNNLVRNNWNRQGAEPHGITPLDGTDIRIVNNEVRNWSAHNIQIGRNEAPTMSGFVIENNDLYLTPEWHTQGGAMARAKGMLHIKASATAGNPGLIIQNRMWGGRITDLSSCCIVGDTVTGIGIIPPTNGGYSYITIQNNVIWDQQKGLVWSTGYSNHQSIVGNIWYKMRVYDTNSFPYSHAIELRATNTTELYMNTFIDNQQHGLSFGGGLGDTDIRCNVFLSAGARQGGAPDSGTRADANAFYDTSAWSFNGSAPNVNQSVVYRSDNTIYATGQVIRLGPPSDCRTDSDAACYLYQVITGGRSASGGQSYCTALDCTVSDGEIVARAIRGPYTFNTRLRSGPEAYTIPYARVATAAPEANRCPSDYSARGGLGINDN